MILKTAEILWGEKEQNMNKKAFLILIFFSAALPLFSQIVKDNPGRLFQLARSFETEGEIGKAHDIYFELYNKNRTNYTYFNSLVRSALSLKKYDEVEKICKSKLKNNPYDVNAYGILGTVYYMQNKRDSASAVWDKAVNLNKNNEINYRIIANYALQNRAFEQALSYLKKAKKIARDPAASSFDIANIYSMTMDYKSAAEEYCELLIKKPNMFSVVERSVDKLLSSPNAAKDITETFENCAEEENGNSVIIKILVNIYTITGKKEKAFELIKKLDSSKKNKGRAILDFANRSLQSGDFAIAEKAFNYFIEKFQNSPYREKGELGLAKSILGKLRKGKKPEFSDDLPQFPSGYISRETAEALKLLEQVYSTSRNSTLVLNSKMLAAKVCAQYPPEYSKAILLLKEIIVSSQNSSYKAESQLALGKIALREGKLKSAEKYFSDVMRSSSVKQEKKNEANYLLGKVKFYEGAFTAALKFLALASNYLKGDFTNDAIKLKSFISIFKSDSLNLRKFAAGELFIEQNLPDSAVKVFNEIAENKNVLILNNLAALKAAEISIATGKYQIAETILKKLVADAKPEILPDKPMFLLGRLLQKEGKLKESLKVYNNFLEKYTNSLYLSVIRENIKLIKEEINGRSKKR